MNPEAPLARLFAAPVRAGRVVWIGLRPARRAPMRPAPCAALDPLDGLAGDHYRSATRRSRQITLIGAEQIEAIASYLGSGALDPSRLRRNVVASGINLHALKGCRLALGGAVLEVTGECHPCSRMEDILGVGGYNAVRGHGGITARIVSGGVVRVGDAVSRLDVAARPLKTNIP